MMYHKRKLTFILFLSFLAFTLAISPARADDSEDTLQVYGILESFPADMIGEWVIDGTTYTADDDTEFEEEHGLFTDMGCVEVKYYTSGGDNYAVEIETEHDYKCSGDSTAYSKVYGIVDSFPANLIGDIGDVWIIGGDEYTANASTKFEQEHGPFFEGGCVEVKYIDNDSIRTAIEIETESSKHCGGQAENKFYGLIEVIPLNPNDGTWTIGDMEFISTPATKLEEEHGEFNVNVCVEVKYYNDANGDNIATEIETEKAYHCSEGSFTQKAYGTIDIVPESLYGTWMINGDNYVASQSTEFEQEHGFFVQGQCVKVKYYTLEGVNQAIEIETEESTKCDGSGDGLPGVSKIYATIDYFPPSPYTGEWGIGGIVFTATVATEFEQEHGIFEVEACVEAKYTTSDDGTNTKTLIEVETENNDKCQGDGPYAFVFKVYGEVVSMPPNDDLTGDWTIGGATYTAGDYTEFSEEHGYFEIGAYVEVKYVLVTYNGTELARLALTIETHVAPGAGLINVQGTLTAHDSSDKVNDWVVDGVTYAADPAIDVGKGSQAPRVGESVMLNLYEINGVQYVTSIQSPFYLFLPMISP